MTNSLTETLRLLVEESGYTHYGFSALENPFSIEAYEEWIDKGLHGEMLYLEKHLPFKKNPEAHFKGLRGAIVLSKSYFPNAQNPPLRIAEYAKSKDYHLTFKEELDSLAKKLKEHFPEEEFLCFTDSAPLLERDLAYRAGLGWVGKNTCLIDRKEGSLFFLGEILTSLPLQESESKSADFCGTCSRCIEVCPTQALKEDRVLDARRCISYLTIEAKGIPPEELRPPIGDWFFGCDLCQTVCPWNEKKFGRDLLQSLSAPVRFTSSKEQMGELQRILRLSNKELMNLFKDSPLSRSRGFGLKRNALILVANLKLTELEEDVMNVARQWPRLKILCDWVLEGLRND